VESGETILTKFCIDTSNNNAVDGKRARDSDLLP